MMSAPSEWVSRLSGTRVAMTMGSRPRRNATHAIPTIVTPFTISAVMCMEIDREPESLYGRART